MPEDTNGITLSKQDLREVTAFAATCAQPVLAVFEADQPDDPRPRDAIGAAWDFARGGERGKLLRDTAWAALKAAGGAETAAAREAAGGAETAAAREAAGGAETAAAREAARAAMSAAGAAYLHPLARATQVKHILGAAAHAARAAELAAGDDPDTGAERIGQAANRATPAVVEVLERFPKAPQGGGRVGELMRMLDTRLRRSASA
ncbi:putative immunity protein [Streptomyces sp. NPDC002667]|uniref:putative immunity protein n=1 Tax=Streptomyces sp. NPDC002667 TaxID=3364657 RepID=UPI0036CB5F2C